MAHSAEDIASYILLEDYNYKREVLHSDVKHGFVIKFTDKPDINIEELETKIKKIIKLDWPIEFAGTNKITIGKWEIYCTGPRTHVKHTGLIKEFKLWPEYVYDPIYKEYMLIGMVGPDRQQGIKAIHYFTDEE